MSEYEKRYIKLREDYELLFHILSSYALDRELWKVAATANPDTLAEITYYAEKAMKELDGKDEEAKKRLEESLRFIKMRDSAALQKLILESNILSAELLKMLFMMGGSRPEAVEKELKKREKSFTDFRKFVSKVEGDED